MKTPLTNEHGNVKNYFIYLSDEGFLLMYVFILVINIKDYNTRKIKNSYRVASKSNFTLKYFDREK